MSTDSDMVELKACPFCGEACELELGVNAYAGCGRCQINFSAYPSEDPTAQKLAANKWNRRAALEASRITELQSALRGLLDHYVSLVNSGDAGFWNPEEEEVVIAARTALDKDGTGL